MSILLKILYLCSFIFVLLMLAVLLTRDKTARKYLKKAAGAAFLASAAVGLFYVYVYIFFRDTFYANPWYLSALAPLVLFWIGYPLLSRFVTPAVSYNLAYSPARTTYGVLAKYFSFTLICAALALAVIALARPRNVECTVLPPTEGVDIMLTLDVSNSMGTADFTPNRLAAAKEAAENFIHKRVSDRIGVVVFASEPMLQSPLTLDYDALLDYLNSVRVGIVRADSTAIGDAVALSSMHLENSKAKTKIIILLTDGENNDGAIPPADAAKSAAALGIKIYGIAAVGRQDVNFDGGSLREIAGITGGKYFRAYDNAGLENIYSEIDKLEKTEFKNLAMVDYDDVYEPFLVLALIFLCVAFVFDKLIFMRLP
ncbi:MAG: VWA domain-containing protein [Elusimicrobium sp.]|jgi:Ca-activated chloride channel family protein|nr:VWA domain-containing protein [Elusimicrobium sp.]